MTRFQKCFCVFYIEKWVLILNKKGLYKKIGLERVKTLYMAEESIALLQITTENVGKFRARLQICKRMIATCP